MKRITGYEKAMTALGNFKFSEFRIVRELRFYETEDRTARRQNVDLVIESDDRNPNYQLKLTFGNVAGLRIEDFGGGETRIIGLEIIDITDRQWEGLYWEVIDFEHNALALRSRTAEIVSVISVSS